MSVRIAYLAAAPSPFFNAYSKYFPMMFDGHSLGKMIISQSDQGACAHPQAVEEIARQWRSCNFGKEEMESLIQLERFCTASALFLDPFTMAQLSTACEG